MACAALIGACALVALSLAAVRGPVRSGGAARRRLDRRRIAGVLIGACFAGTLLGALTGERRREACTATLLSGDSLTVVGTVTARIRAAGRGRVRVRLGRVSVAGAAGDCRLPALLTRTEIDGTPPAPGTRVRVAGEWMRFDDAADPAWPAAPDRRGMLTGRLTVVEEATAAEAGPLLALRSRAANRLTERLAPDVAPTALALLLAERDEIDPELRRRFVDAGLAHLLAISGMHVGLLAAGVLWVLGFAVSARWRMPAGLALVAIYVLLIGAPAAARRALSVFAGLTWTRVRGWPARPGELLGAALLVVMLLSPGGLLDPGLQLSFAGFAGVIAGHRAGAVFERGRAGRDGPGRGRARGRSGAVSTVWQAAGAGAGALLATMPITALHFGQTTPVSILSHFAGGPLVGIGLGSLAATLALPGALAGPAADIATGTLRALHFTADLFARLPGGHRTVSAPAATTWLAWILTIEGVRRVVTAARPRAAVGPVALAGALLVAGPSLRASAVGPALLCTLSVGQGDAAVLRTSRGRWLVFDGGPAWGDWNAGTAIVEPFLRRHGAAGVELAVLSHPDLDHLGGLRGLLPEIPVARILDSGDPVPSEAYADFLDEIDAAGARWIPAAAGDRLRIDDAALTVLGPVPPSKLDGRVGSAAEGPSKAGGVNATSLAFRLSIGAFRYLNTGDATRREEDALLAAWAADSLRADVLKIGHHGSRTSSGSAFLSSVAPDLAVVSAGARNLYGHPHPDVLRRIDAAGIGRLWRTDRQGTLCIEIRPDGRWRVRGERAWHTPD